MEVQRLVEETRRLEDHLRKDDRVQMVHALAGMRVQLHEDDVDVVHPLQDLAAPRVGPLAPLLRCGRSGWLGPPPDLEEARLGS